MPLASPSSFPSAERRLSRRGFLKSAAFTGAGLVAAAAFGCEGQSNATPSPARTATLATVTRKPTAAPTARQLLQLHPNPSYPPLAPANPLAIVHARLIDGNGAIPREEALILVRNGLIESVTVGSPPSSEYEVMDATGKTVMPGLVDGHVHITRQILQVTPDDLASKTVEDGLLPFLRQGFTLLRDVGTATVIFATISYQIAGFTRNTRAPTVVWAGPIVTTPDGYPYTVPRYSASAQDILSPEEGASLVDELANNGAAIIKIAIEKGYYADEGWPLLSAEEVSAITTRAHERGLLVTAHVTSLDEVRLAIDNGVDNLAHTPLERMPDDLIREMVADDCGLVSTATIWEPQHAQVAADNVKRFADSGGRVSIGTDFGCCEQIAGIASYLREMEFLQNAGMTPEQLLTAATRDGAILANAANRTGTAEPGKRADLILVDGDPLADLQALRRVSAVIQGGYRVA